MRYVAWVILASALSVMAWTTVSSRESAPRPQRTPEQLQRVQARIERQIKRGLHHAEQVMAYHIKQGEFDDKAYREFLAILDEIESLPGADESAAGIDGLKFTGTLVYHRGLDEVEAALRAALAALAPDERMGRITATAAAYAAYPQLGSYLEAEANAARDVADAAQRAELLSAVQRARGSARRKHGSTVR